MSDREANSEKYVKAKKTIRALLVSSKGGCSPRSLVDDYKYLYGESIPYEELGFRSLMELLHHMKDVVVVQHRVDGVRLYGIADEKTRHIAGMVAKQKSSKKGRTENVPSYPTTNMVTRRGRSWGSVHTQQLKPPVAFQAQLKSLFQSYPNGIALHNFTEAFARRFGYYFGYRGWGFSSLEEVLRSIPEIITVEKDPTRSCRIVKLVKSSLWKQEGPSEGVKRSPTEAVNSQQLHTLVSGEVQNSAAVQSTTESLNSLELSPKKTVFVPRSVKEQPPRRRKITVPEKVVKQIETILRAFPAGIWISNFPMQFKKYFDEDLPVSALGFSSVVHMLTSTPVCEVERPTGMGDWLVFRKGGPRPKVADNHQCLHEAYVSDQMVKDIHKILRLYQKGIPLNKFLSAFQEVKQCELPVEEIGFNSVTELLQRVPGVEVYKPPDSTKLMVFCTAPFSESETESSDSSDKLSAKDKDALLSDVSSQNKPRSVYYQQSAPSKDVRMCPVYVTHVKTPSCFCVQLIGERSTKALEALQEDMTAFFNSKDGEAYAIKEPCVGQACCSIFNNDGYWYRSEIVSIPTFDVVEVRYVDYGNSAQVPLAAIRRPKAHYITLPAQAINCRLANLKPAGSTWSRTATQLLFQMTKDKPIVAIITAVQDNCMSVCLCDTTTQRDIHINDCLCSQGLAMFNEDTPKDHRDFDGYQLESANLISADEKDVRSPRDLGKIASVSLKAVLADSPSLQQLEEEREKPSPSVSTESSHFIATLPAPSQSSFIATTAVSSLSTPSTTPVSSATPSLPSMMAGGVPIGAVPKQVPYFIVPMGPFQMSNAQLQMQNYFNQLLLLQQNAMLGRGAMPMVGPQGMAYPDVGQTGVGSGQTTSQPGLRSSQVGFPPPGFAHLGLGQSNVPQQQVQASTLLGNSCLNPYASGHTSQGGLTTQQQPAVIFNTVGVQQPTTRVSQTALTDHQQSTVVSNTVGYQKPNGKTSQTGLTTQQQPALILNTVGHQQLTGQASQTGLTTHQQSALVSNLVGHNNPPGQVNQSGLMSITPLSSSLVDHAPASIASSIRQQPTSNHTYQIPSSINQPPTSSHTYHTSCSTHPSEGAALPSIFSEAVVVTNCESARNGLSSPSIFPSTEESSSLSSEEEILQSTCKWSSHGDSCLADSESDAQLSSFEQKLSFIDGDCRITTTSKELLPQL